MKLTVTAITFLLSCILAQAQEIKFRVATLEKIKIVLEAIPEINQEISDLNKEFAKQVPSGFKISRIFIEATPSQGQCTYTYDVYVDMVNKSEGGSNGIIESFTSPIVGVTKIGHCLSLPSDPKPKKPEIS